MEHSRTYRIGEIARLTGLSVETLRYYERRRLLRTPARSTGGFRRYTDDVLHRLRFIKQAQSLGMTLDDVHQLVASQPNRSRTACRRVHDLLARRVAEIDARMQELRRLRRTLDAHRRSCARALSDTDDPACPTLHELAGTEL